MTDAGGGLERRGPATFAGHELTELGKDLVEMMLTTYFVLLVIVLAVKKLASYAKHNPAQVVEVASIVRKLMGK